MVVKEDQTLRKLIDREKEKIPTDLGDFVKFLAYTHDDGPDDVEQEPERKIGRASCRERVSKSV